MRLSKRLPAPRRRIAIERDRSVFRWKNVSDSRWPRSVYQSAPDEDVKSLRSGFGRGATFYSPTTFVALSRPHIRSSAAQAEVSAGFVEVTARSGAARVPLSYGVSPVGRLRERMGTAAPDRTKRQVSIKQALVGKACGSSGRADSRGRTPVIRLPPGCVRAPPHDNSRVHQRGRVARRKALCGRLVGRCRRGGCRSTACGAVDATETATPSDSALDFSDLWEAPADDVSGGGGHASSLNCAP